MRESTRKWIVALAFLTALAGPLEVPRAEGDASVASLVENMAAMESAAVSADMTFQVERHRAGHNAPIRQEGAYQILRGRGRYRAVGEDTMTGFRQATAFGYLPGEICEIWSESPFPGDGRVGLKGYGTIYRGDDVNDSSLSRGRDGNWLFGYDFFLDDSNLPRRLARADTGQLTLATVEGNDGNPLHCVAAKLDVGDYELTFDPRYGMNLVRVKIDRRRQDHTGLPEDYPYSEFTFEGEIAYEVVDGNFVPKSGTAHVNSTAGQSASEGSTATDISISLSNIRLTGELSDEAFRIVWPPDSVAFDVEAKRNMLVSARGEFEPLRESGPMAYGEALPESLNTPLLFGALATVSVAAAWFVWRRRTRA